MGGEKDRALRNEIDREREWRLRQWRAGMMGDAPPPEYLFDDDGEIEPESYHVKRKRIEE